MSCKDAAIRYMLPEIEEMRQVLRANNLKIPVNRAGEVSSEVRASPA